MSFSSVSYVNVALQFSNRKIPVGKLALNNHKIYFEYEHDFIKSSLDLSPIKLPLKVGLQTFDNFLFDGLPGLFYDSLPDGWGRLLLDRSLRYQGILPEQLSPLDRLIYVGNNGMGALVYEPAIEVEENFRTIDLNHLAAMAQEVLNGEAQDVLHELLTLNGSSAGARPKAMIGVDCKREKIIHGVTTIPNEYEAWMVKFANSQDGPDAGAIEYVYALMAKQAGLKMTKTHLFTANNHAGYFATKRFDRDGKNRIHTHSACGLLHSDFRLPSLDYEDLLALTNIVTRDFREVEKMFQLAVFNVLSHNRDDHAKNFSFLMNKTGEWKLSPAYDITFSTGPQGEQSTMAMGEGKNPTIEHLLKLGLNAKLKKVKINAVINQTKSALSQWDTLAKDYGVSQVNRKLIGKYLTTN
ncbi:Toxin HigB / Protein kinase domain of HipA [hydrothermal vent metagenome]|uniref:Toxin HigB / Protein kinase domain of HipA n=1 Tax=hydrothermal vent metagenome TaxID=652676 RepID=A0A3B0VTE3_9ZZZZ